MKTCIAIARVSSDGQAGEDKSSIDTQLDAIRTWCSDAGYTVVEEVREEGVSVSGDLNPNDARPFWAA